ncbi:glycoside hydrolase family 31 protein [Paenibacillus abyssi]|uniref:glycoside hydrolase family 31 protein n=1 Tax=Paenibacillus abyssi TaxID=1340531 RepID=UPI001666D6A7|nr:TIM-barrel domain-containing protein [Paenibacillus abyssi]
MSLNDIRLLNESIDVSQSFHKTENLHFHLNRVTVLDAHTGRGSIEWQRHGYKIRTSFNQVMLPFERTGSWEFPPEYEQDKVLPFDISFVSDRVVRVRLSGKGPLGDAQAASPMIERLGETKWSAKEEEGTVVYESAHGSLTVERDPLRFVLRDRSGRVLTRTKQMADVAGLLNNEPRPTSFVRRSADLRRYMALSLELIPGEAIIGGGESFTRLNKRGQKLNLWMNDPKGVMNRDMYKPVPFLMSSNGYGMFVHTSAPVTLDIGHSYDGAQTVYVGDDMLDIFFFLGGPHEILGAYTQLTGRSPVPPLWSFGLWMSRITYNTQDEVLDVAQKLREHQIPCDVLHLDTGWFDVEWRCNYEFSPSRFPDPKAMLDRLKAQNFHLSLWQVPYFTPTNTLYQEAIDKGYVILDADGKLPTEDAIVDFSNPEAIEWFKGLITRLFDLGISAIKADFGEEAPLHGAYASGKTGRFEHNLYALRYTGAVYEASRRGDDHPVIWARSAWAGGQKYPVHWGGDPEATDGAFAASIRGGLSLGASGFSFWSHDNGGFVKRSPEELYLRWLACGMFSSHTRCHGQPPKEPWLFDEAFMDRFRAIVNMRYQLMPYIYAQAVVSAEKGLPMVRALCIDYPEDPLVWEIDDSYMFGDSMLVAPLFHSGHSARKVYLPEGAWIDYQTHKAYEGGKVHNIQAGAVPLIVLVKDGTLIPHIPLAQSTQEMDWEALEYVAYAADAKQAAGVVCLPNGRPELINYELSHGGQDKISVIRSQ